MLPALVAFGGSDIQNGISLIIYTLVGIFLFGSALTATRGRIVYLDRTNTIYLAVVAWLFFPLVLAVPLSDLFQIGYLDAVFEAVSAFTTSAADGISNLEKVPPSAVLLRAILQWSGGLATIITFALFLGPIRAGGLPRPRSSVGEGVGRSTTGINRVALTMLRYFSLASMLCLLLILMTGVDAFSALVLTSTAMTAGGYIPAGKTISELGSPLTMIVMGIFFITATTNIFWQRMVLRWQVANLKAHRESYYLIAVIAVLTLTLSLILINVSGGRGSGYGRLFSEAFFNATSLVSTSGLQSRPGVFALLSPGIVILILLMGGGCYSMAGGIKYYRIGAMLVHSDNELSRLIYPNSVPRQHFGSELYSLRLMKSIWTMFVSMLAILVCGAVSLALSGLSFQASIIAAVAAITNAGPAYSTDWVPSGTPGWIAYSDMNVAQKMTLCIVMIFGRLEVIALLVALNPYYWLKR